MGLTLVDTNIIIYAINKNSSYHELSKKVLRDWDDLIIADQNINEALRTLTHTVYKKRLTTKEGLNAVFRATERCNLIKPNSKTRETFYELVTKYKVKSDNIYDAYLAATALSNNIERIATFNMKDFKKYDELDVVEVD